jgi:hypothetical protein
MMVHRSNHKLRPWALLGATAALAAGLLVGAPPAAAEGCDEGADAENKQGKFHIEYINGKPVTVIDTEIAVCGKVPRPSVVYVLTAKNIDYEWENLKQDFMPLVLKSVKKAPF